MSYLRVSEFKICTSIIHTSALFSWLHYRKHNSDDDDDNDSDNKNSRNRENNKGSQVLDKCINHLLWFWLPPKKHLWLGKLTPYCSRSKSEFWYNMTHTNIVLHMQGKKHEKSLSLYTTLDLSLQEYMFTNLCMILF